MSKFRGLGQLDGVHDRLEHGAELQYSEDMAVSEERIVGFLKHKQHLNVFRAIEPNRGPDYASKDIVDEVFRLADKDSRNQD